METQTQESSPPHPADPHAYYVTVIAGREAAAAEQRRLVKLLWEAYSEDVFLYAYAKLKNRDDARDVCQDAFLRALNWIVERSTQLPSKVNFPAWLRRIARNLIVDRFRNAAVAREIPASQVPAADEGNVFGDWRESRDPGPGVELSADEQLAAVRDCIAQLKERWRQLVLLRDLAGSDYAAISRELGMAVAVVQLNIHRARQTVRECLDRKFARAGGGMA